MRITSEGDNVRVQLVRTGKAKGIEMLMDFLIPEDEWVEFKTHVIENLLKFQSKKRHGIEFIYIEQLKTEQRYPDSELPDNHPDKFEWDFSDIEKALKENNRVVIM